MQPTLVSLPGKIPWTKESGGLQSVGSQRVRHDLASKQQQNKKKPVDYFEVYFLFLFSLIREKYIGEISYNSGQSYELLRKTRDIGDNWFSSY